MLVVTYILALIGYRNWFILAMPVAAMFIIALFGRFLLKKGAGLADPKASKLMLFIALIVVVISVFIILLVILSSKAPSS